MDVYCAKCREPYEFLYMQDGEFIEEEDVYDEYQETREITDHMRKALWEEGWIFGRTFVIIKECPSCWHKESSELPSELSMVQDMLEDSLGDDIDGIASEMDDYMSLYG